MRGNQAAIDDNDVKSLLAVSSVDGESIVVVWADPVTHALLVKTVNPTVLDHKVSVSATDTTPDYLISKLVADTNITLTKENPGGNEDIKIQAIPTSPTNSVQYNNNGAFGGVANTTTNLEVLTQTGNGVLAGTPTFTVATYVDSNSTIVSRDSAGNSAFNNVISTTTPIVSANQTIAMTYGSSRGQVVSGTANVTFNLPDATYLYTGENYEFNNNSTGTIIIYKNDGTTLVGTVPSMGFGYVICDSNSTVNGVWDIHYFVTPNTFVPYTGATTNVNLGTHSLTTTGDGAFGNVTLGSTSAIKLLRVFNTDGTDTSGIFVVDQEEGLGTWQNASSLEGITVLPSGVINSFGTLWLNYYSNGDVLIGHGGGNVGIEGRLIIGDTSESLTPSFDLSFSYAANRQIWIERNPSSAGNILTVQAGGAGSGTDNKAGGTLILSGGISTGNGSSIIQFQTATAGASHSGDQTPTTKWTITSTGTLESGIAGADAFNILTAGDIQAATYHVGAVAGIDATVTYVDTLLGAKTLVFKKGLLTSQS